MSEVVMEATHDVEGQAIPIENLFSLTSEVLWTSEV